MMNLAKGASGNWLQQGVPKDTIPVVKTPRRQRSSRFFAHDKVELEQYPHFNGNLQGDTYSIALYCINKPGLLI